MNSSLTPQDITEFWIRVYFGASEDLIGAAIDKAYLDFNRTQHGYAKLKTDLSSARLKEVLKNITSQAIAQDYSDQHAYDDWHELSCDYLKDQCYDLTTYQMSYGQAQKWINMSLKYMFALGRERIPGVTKNFQWFHIPIDNIIQKMLKNQITPFKIAWSRIEDYNEYLNYQKQFRALHPTQIPLDVEFRLFNQILKK
jgi:hypothetical protein